MAEMNALLLKKLEETTLYLIEQEKKMQGKLQTMQIEMNQLKKDKKKQSTNLIEF